MAVIGQEVLQADNLTTGQKEGKKSTYIFILGNYIWKSLNTIIKHSYKVSLNNNEIKIMIKSQQTA